MSGVEGQLEITRPNTVTLAKFADQMEFEALVPVARWWGFGSANDPQGPGFEAYTLAADIAASTAWCGVVSTSHVSLNHPIIAAHAPLSTTSPMAASRSTSCAAGTGRRWKCST